MVLTFALALISCGTKEIAIVSPLFIMLTDWFFIAQGDWHIFKKRIPLHILFFLTVLGIYIYLLKTIISSETYLELSMVAHNNIGNVLTENPAEPIKPLHFFISQFKVILHYLMNVYMALFH